MSVFTSVTFFPVEVFITKRLMVEWANEGSPANFLKPELKASLICCACRLVTNKINKGRNNFFNTENLKGDF